VTVTQVLVLVLGITSSVTLVISALSVHKHRLLIFGIVTGLIVSLQYGLVGSWAGLAVNAVGIVRTLMVVGSEKRPWMNHWLFIPVFFAIHALAWSLTTNWNDLSWISFVPLIGGWGGTVAIYFKDVIVIKGILIALGCMWLFYEFHSELFSQMIGESLNLVSNVVAFITLFIALRKGIPEDLIEDLDTQLIETITSSIPTVTKSLETITSSIRINRSPKAIRGYHNSSVAYSRMLEDQEIQEKR